MEEIKKAMYYGAKPETFEAARILRENMTSYEILLWEKLKNKQICGIRFRRQLQYTSLLQIFIVMKLD